MHPGTSALLFGSAAIGGVVNVIDSRIPRRIPDEGAHVAAILTYGSAADERSANATIDVPVGPKELAVGFGSIWAMCDSGKIIARIDMVSDKVRALISEPGGPTSPCALNAAEKMASITNGKKNVKNSVLRQ